MIEEQKQPTKRKGFYTKKLASFQQANPVFKRSKKKEIKKQNKQSCKEARQRKKIYVAHLEHQNQTLLQENNQLKQQIAKLKLNLEENKKVVVTQSDQRIKMLANQFRELMIALNKENKQAISRSLAVLRDKFSISGRQRKKWIEESFLRTIELSMPLHFRILIENVDDSYKFFEMLGGNDEMRKYRISMGQKQKNILKEMKPKIKKAKQNFNNIFLKLHSVWTDLTKYTHQAQKIIDSIEDNLDPVFVGNMLVNLDSKRCSSDQIKQMYPINFFKNIPQERQVLAQYYQPQSSLFLDSEDNYAFGTFFGID